MSLCEQMTPGHNQFGPQGHVGKILYRGSLNSAIILNIYAVCLIVERFFKVFFFYHNLWKLMAQGFCQFGSQEHVWQDLCRRLLDIALYNIYKL